MPIPTSIHARIDGPLVMVGIESIGKGTLPLILRSGRIVTGRPSRAGAASSRRTSMPPTPSSSAT